MSKEDKKDILSHISEISSDLLPQQEKLSRKQKLLKLLLTTDLKNPRLRPVLRPIKKNLAKNFSFSNYSFQSDDINDLFRVYLNEGKDIYVWSKQKKYLPSLKVNVWNPHATSAAPTKIIPLHHYRALLNTIIHQVASHIHEIQPLVKEAKKQASLAHPERAEPVFTKLDAEDESKIISQITTEYFDTLMKAKFKNAEVKYDQDRFDDQCKNISDPFDQGNYQELMLFALRGLHYFKKRDAVYSAFSRAQLASYLSFDLPGESPYMISLQDFLELFEQLDFKKHLFAL